MTDSSRPSGTIVLRARRAVGSGKGTQAARLARELGRPHLASGNLFRAALEAGTPLGDVGP